jgi:hypothetical protein
MVVRELKEQLFGYTGIKKYFTALQRSVIWGLEANFWILFV